jgi:16S rRNA (cytosine967-C5)-methyltransferase
LREADIATFAARQREILSAAMTLCAPAGRVIYATCSLLHSENDEIVAHYTTIPLRQLLLPERAAALGDGDSFSVTPLRHGTDGFFARVIAPRH